MSTIVSSPDSPRRDWREDIHRALRRLQVLMKLRERCDKYVAVTVNGKVIDGMLDLDLVQQFERRVTRVQLVHVDFACCGVCDISHAVFGMNNPVGIC